MPHVVILDAGSGGTRPYIYAIREATPIGDVFQNAKVSEVFRKNGTPISGRVGGPPLSSLPHSTDLTSRTGIHELTSAQQVAVYLDPIFAEVNRTLPAGVAINTVRLFLLATGGVRDLQAGPRANLLLWLTNYTDALGYAQVVCEAISGTDEAKFGWVAANYSQGHAPPYEFGYVEMGGASAQIAFALPADGSLNVTADNVVQAIQQGDDVNTAASVPVGPRSVFLASYRLGSKVGYEKYKEVLFASGDARVIGNGNVFNDPSKRQGYMKVEGNRMIRGAASAHWQGGGLNHIGLMQSLATLAVEALNPLALAATPLDPYLRGLSFIGGGNFWWGTYQAPVDANDFRWQTYFRDLKDSSLISHAQFVANTGGNEASKRAILDNSVFTGYWISRVLAHGFGMTLNNMTFTPYNGNGDRLSWTLGKAVLLAAPNLERLCCGMAACISP